MQHSRWLGDTFLQTAEDGIFSAFLLPKAVHAKQTETHMLELSMVLVFWISTSENKHNSYQVTMKQVPVKKPHGDAELHFDSLYKGGSCCFFSLTRNKTKQKKGGKYIKKI